MKFIGQLNDIIWIRGEKDEHSWRYIILEEKICHLKIRPILTSASISFKVTKISRAYKKSIQKCTNNTIKFSLIPKSCASKRFQLSFNKNNTTINWWSDFQIKWFFLCHPSSTPWISRLHHREDRWRNALEDLLKFRLWNVTKWLYHPMTFRNRKYIEPQLISMSNRSDSHFERVYTR